MRWYEVAFGPHYPLLYAHRDAAEAARAIALLARLAPLGAGPVLDLACGAGRHLGPLAAVGAPVVGVDLSLPLLHEARRELTAGPGRIALLRADMRAVPLRDGTVTAVVSLFTSFGYFGPLAAHAGVLAEVARLLAPGGHWFLDYLNCAAVRHELAGVARPARRRLIGGLEVAESRRLEPDRVVKTIVLRADASAGEKARAGVPPEGLAYTEEVALFALSELDELAAAVGLRRIAAAGDYDGGPLTDDSPRWIVAYRREAAEPGRGDR
jgi:SAM-dependent methyltransferase